MSAAVRAQGSVISTGVRDLFCDYRARGFDSQYKRGGDAGGDCVLGGRLTWDRASGVTRRSAEWSSQRLRLRSNGPRQALLERSRFRQGQGRAVSAELRPCRWSLHGEAFGASLGYKELPGAILVPEVRCRARCRPGCNGVQYRCRRSSIVCPALQNVDANDSEFSEEELDEAPSPSPRSRMEILRSSLQRILEADWSRILFGLPKKEKLPWTVPWSAETIFQVMFLWFAAFWLVGSWIIPIAAQAMGCSKDSLTYRGQALYSLITDIAEGTVGLVILQRCLSKFHPLPGNWFPISWQGKWYVEACLGCFMFPLVNRLSQLNLTLLPFPTPYSSSQVEQSIMARDPVATFLYAVVVSVCAPVWEEVIFRGFLLPSLTKYLPVWASVIVSSLAFACAHFSAQRLFPLTFLGLVMGIIFVRSRNLLASMLLHSLWNGFVFLDLLR